jgi:hypothetical protein
MTITNNNMSTNFIEKALKVKAGRQFDADWLALVAAIKNCEAIKHLTIDIGDKKVSILEIVLKVQEGTQPSNFAEAEQKRIDEIQESLAHELLTQFAGIKNFIKSAE